MWPFSPTAIAANASTIDELLSQLTSHEAMLHNITVSGNAWDETSQDPKNLAWVKDAVGASAKGWYDAAGSARVRVDVRRSVVPWIQGAAPFSEQSFVAAFDGKIGTVINVTSGAIGKANPLQSAVLQPARPGNLQMQGFATGAVFSNFYNGAQSSLSQVLKKRIAAVRTNAPGVPITVSNDPFDGVPCVRLTLGRDNVSESWWFDPARGYSLVEYLHLNQRPDGQPICSSEVRVVSLDEVAPGVWYPREAFRYLPWYMSQASHYAGDPVSTTDVRRRTHYIADSIVANDPHFDERIFSPPIPIGYFVNDQIHNTNYRTTTSSEALNGDLPEMLKAIGGPKLPQGDREAAELRELDEAADRNHRIFVVSATVIIVLAMIAIIGIQRRRKILLVRSDA